MVQITKEEFKPSGKASIVGVLIGSLVLLALSIPIGFFYGFVLSKSRFLGTIVFVSLGIATFIPSFYGIYLGKIRNQICAGFFGFFSCLIIVIGGNLFALNAFKVENQPYYYSIFLVVNFITAVGISQLILSLFLLFDEKNGQWYKKKFSGIVDSSDFGKLELIITENTTIDGLKNLTFTAPPQEMYKSVDVIIKTSVPGTPAYIKVKNTFKRGEEIKTQELKGLIPYEWADVLEEKISTLK